MSRSGEESPGRGLIVKTALVRTHLLYGERLSELNDDAVTGNARDDALSEIGSAVVILASCGIMQTFVRADGTPRFIRFGAFEPLIIWESGLYGAVPALSIVYQKQHTKLLQASAEWLRFGTYEGRSPGSISK